MRLRIISKFWLVVGVLGGIAAAAAIILTTLLGGGSTDVASIDNIIETEATVTAERPDINGTGSVIGLTAGADKAEAKKNEAKNETETPTTEVATEAQTQAATQAPAQQPATQRQTQAATQPAKKSTTQKSTQKPTQAATQPATTKASNSNADEFRGKQGAGNVDVGGEITDYESYVDSGTRKTGGQAGEKEAWGGGQVEY